jgi:phosphatidylglycerophosphate synthase
MGTHLKVFLLIVEPARRLFYSEVAAPPDNFESAGSPGLRGRLEALLQRARTGWQEPQGTAARLSRRVWEWLHRHTHPDETLYARLRTARAIDLNHPAAMETPAVDAAWAAFLARGRRRHWPWLVVNTLVAPLTIVLAPLPGPNVIGYWFVYRAVHHLLILHGLRRVRAGRVDVRFHALAELDRPVGCRSEPDSLPARLAGLGCDPSGLRDFLARQGVWPPGAGREGGALTVKPVTPGGPGEAPLAARCATGVVNALTAGRLALAGVFPVVPSSWRLPVIVAGGLSDLLDGWISRRFRVTSTFGQVVDPIADKAFMASVLLTLWHGGLVRAWQLPLVGFRDLAVAFGTARAVAGRGWGAVAHMPPSLLGKLTTAAQFVFLAAVLYHLKATPYALALATALSLAAGVGYLWRPPSTT